MAALDMHEQEQVDALKNWWKDNGKKLIILAVLTITIGLGVYGWRSWQNGQQSAASAAFLEFIKLLPANDNKRIDEAAADLSGKYPSSIYAARAKLMAAQMNIGAKKNDAAVEQMQWVVDHGNSDLRDAARLKLASLRLDEKKFDDALKLIDAPHAETFDASYMDLKGDVLNAQGRKDEARAAYRKALSEVQSGAGGNGGLSFAMAVRIKFEGLGGDSQEVMAGAAK